MILEVSLQLFYIGDERMGKAAASGLIVLSLTLMSFWGGSVTLIPAPFHALGSD